MATTRYDLEVNGDWVEVAASGADFLLQNVGYGSVKVTLADSAPGAGAAYHVLPAGQAMLRAGSGAVYVKAYDGNQASAVVCSA